MIGVLGPAIVEYQEMGLKINEGLCVNRDCRSHPMELAEVQKEWVAAQVGGTRITTSRPCIKILLALIGDVRRADHGTPSKCYTNHWTIAC